MDFEGLAQDIHESENGSERQLAAIHRFIRNFSKESHYWVACQWKENVDDMEAFVGYHNDDDNKPCFYVFTEEQLAHNFSSYYGLADPDGKCYAMKLPMSEFMRHVEFYQVNGVELLMFNDGGYYFMCDIDSIIDIIKAS